MAFVAGSILGYSPIQQTTLKSEELDSYQLLYADTAKDSYGLYPKFGRVPLSTM
jgi:hypothetical protein